MFENFFDFVKSGGQLAIDKAGDPSDQELQIATAALLWEVSAADADQKSLEAELAKLTKVLKKAFDLSEAEVEKISSIASLVDDKDKLDHYIALVNAHFSVEQRDKIVEMAKCVALADHELDLGEAVVCDLLRKRLKLT